MNYDDVMKLALGRGFYFLCATYSCSSGPIPTLNIMLKFLVFSNSPWQLGHLRLFSEIALSNSTRSALLGISNFVFSEINLSALNVDLHSTFYYRINEARKVSGCLKNRL